MTEKPRFKAVKITNSDRGTYWRVADKEHGGFVKVLDEATARLFAAAPETAERVRELEREGERLKGALTDWDDEWDEAVESWECTADELAHERNKQKARAEKAEAGLKECLGMLRRNLDGSMLGCLCGCEHIGGYGPDEQCPSCDFIDDVQDLLARLDGKEKS